MQDEKSQDALILFHLEGLPLFFCRSPVQLLQRVDTPPRLLVERQELGANLPAVLQDPFVVHGPAERQILSIIPTVHPGLEFAVDLETSPLQAQQVIHELGVRELVAHKLLVILVPTIIVITARRRMTRQLVRGERGVEPKWTAAFPHARDEGGLRLHQQEGGHVALDQAHEGSARVGGAEDVLMQFIEGGALGEERRVRVGVASEERLVVGVARAEDDAVDAREPPVVLKVETLPPVRVEANEARHHLGPPGKLGDLLRVGRRYPDLGRMAG